MDKIIYNYITTNILNGKQYVGMHSSDNVDDNYLGSGNELKRALIKYGRENFKRTVLCICSSINEAFKNETKYIKQYNTLHPNGYNLSPAGGLLMPGCFTDKMREMLIERNKKPISEETRNKMRNKFISDATREKIRISSTGRKHTIEFKQKLSDRNRKWKRSEQTKLNISNATKGRTPWNKGKKGVSSETRIKMSKSSKLRYERIAYEKRPDLKPKE